MSRDDVGRVPMLLQDREYMSHTNDLLLVRPTTEVDVRDGRLRDGPASDRVAVIDLGDGDRPARAPAKLLPPVGRRRMREFEFDQQLLDPDLLDPLPFEDDTFVQLHVFGSVHATLRFFEELLGRRVRWACTDEQLALVPWAGTGRNAYYERATGSIRFQTYTTTEGRHILFALSRDIVSHEAAHAILDAVAPDLHDATDPDSLTIHEAVGDLAAVLQTLLDEALVFSADVLLGGGLDGLEKLGLVAEEVGAELGRRQGASALRSASSAASFSGAEPGRSVVDRSDPHEASTVVVAALFAALRERVVSGERAFERAVCVAAGELARIVVPALHRLPAGEVSLVDFARALDSAARETAPGRWWMDAITRQLVERGVGEAASLRAPALSPKPLDDWRWPSTASRLAEANRERLAVPPDASLIATTVEFRDRTWTKTPRHRVQLRVAWDIEETHDIGYGLSDQWLFRAGTTAVVDVETGVPVSILSGGTDDAACERRDNQLRRWANAGLIYTLRSVDADGSQRIVGTAQTLHLLNVG
jgi:hypothetical protein